MLVTHETNELLLCELIISTVSAYNARDKEKEGEREIESKKKKMRRKDMRKKKKKGSERRI